MFLFFFLPAYSLTKKVYSNYLAISMTSLILWPPDAKEPTHWKRPDAGQDRGQKEKEATENETVGWYHQINGHELEQTLGNSEGEGSLACCSPWGCKELDITEQLNNNNAIWILTAHACVLSHFSCVRLFVTSWIMAYQAAVSMGFSRQECWSGLPFPPPEFFPTQGLNSHLKLPALAGMCFTTCATWEALSGCTPHPKRVDANQGD